MSSARDKVEAAVEVAVAAIGVWVVGTLATGMWGGTGGWTTRSAYDIAAWLFIAVIVAAALAAASGRWSDIRRAVALVAAAALVGRAIVAHRRWVTAAGFSSTALNLDRLQSLAVLLAASAAGLTVVVFALVMPLIRRERPRPWVVAAGFVIAATAAGSVPFVMGDEYGGSKTTSIGAHALLYSIPWALAIWMVVVGSRSAAIGVSIMVLAHQILMVVDGPPVIPMRNPVTGSLVAALAIGIGWALRARASRR